MKENKVCIKEGYTGGLDCDTAALTLNFYLFFICLTS